MRAGDRAEPRDPDQGAHLGLAEGDLLAHRPEHPDERLLDVLRQLVDDAIGADLDALAVGERARLRARAHVEADDQRARGGGEVDVALGDAPDAGMDDADAHLGVLDLFDLADGSLHGALDVCLDDEPELLDVALLHLLEQA